MRLTVCLSAVMLLSCLAVSPRSTNAEPIQTNANWFSDYSKAMAAAEKQGKMMLVLFHRSGDRAGGDWSASETFDDAAIREKLQRYVCVRVPVDAKIKVRGQETTLLDSPAFEGLKKQPGVAVLDFAHKKADYHGCVVTALPITAEGDLSTDEAAVLLDLPPGTPAERSRAYTAKLAEAAAGEPLFWHDDYAQAMDEADRERKMMLIVFGAKGDASRCDCLKADVLSDPAVRAKLGHFVRVRLPMDATIREQGKEVKLLDQPAFAEMLHRQGDRDSRFRPPQGRVPRDGGQHLPDAGTGRVFDRQDARDLGSSAGHVDPADLDLCGANPSGASGEHRWRHPPGPCRGSKQAFEVSGEDPLARPSSLGGPISSNLGLAAGRIDGDGSLRRELARRRALGGGDRVRPLLASFLGPLERGPRESSLLRLRHETRRQTASGTPPASSARGGKGLPHFPVPSRTRPCSSKA